MLNINLYTVNNKEFLQEKTIKDQPVFLLTAEKINKQFPKIMFSDNFLNCILNNPIFIDLCFMLKDLDFLNYIEKIVFNYKIEKNKETHINCIINIQFNGTKHIYNINFNQIDYFTINNIINYLEEEYNIYYNNFDGLITNIEENQNKSSILNEKLKKNKLKLEIKDKILYLRQENNNSDENDIRIKITDEYCVLNAIINTLKYLKKELQASNNNYGKKLKYKIQLNSNNFSNNLVLFAIDFIQFFNNLDCNNKEFQINNDYIIYKTENFSLELLLWKTFFDDLRNDHEKKILEYFVKLFSEKFSELKMSQYLEEQKYLFDKFKTNKKPFAINKITKSKENSFSILKNNNK